MVDSEKKRRSRSSSSSSCSSSSSSGSSSRSSSSSSVSPSPRKRRNSGKSPVRRSPSPRRLSTRDGARADRGGRKSRRSPSPRRGRRYSSPRRRRSGSRGAGDRRPKKASPRRDLSPRKRSPSRKVSINNLSANVKKEHLDEIFSIYGTIVTSDLPLNPHHKHLNRGFGLIEFEKSEDAEKAIKYMNEGQIDGKVISLEIIEARQSRGAYHHRSPPKRSPVRRSSPRCRDIPTDPRRRSSPRRVSGANDVPLGSRRGGDGSRSRSPRRRS